MSAPNELEVFMLELVNAERAAAGLNPLVFNGDLNEASEDHSTWMLETDTFSHTGVNGSSAGDRIVAAGYELEGSWTYGENIGFQSGRGAPGWQDDVADVHVALMNSPGHRANILDPDYEEIGIGVEIGEYGGFNVVMITQNFGTTDATPTPQPPVGVEPGTINFASGQQNLVLPQSTESVVVNANELNNTITGSNGDEVFNGNDGFDTIFAGLGDDTLRGGEHADKLHGGAGNDFIDGGAGFDNLFGEAGDDTLMGGATADRLYGGTQNDELYGGSNVGITVDGLFGEEGDDTLYGQAGFDHLEGGIGNDLLDGGHQADNLYGGAGDDTLRGDLGLDRLFGGDGNDFGRGGEGNDGLFGEAGDDTLNGEAGDDRFFGGTGSDDLDGSSGNDTLYGGAGFDTLKGGLGDDILQGDFNADTFVFRDGEGNDTITDFAATNPFERIDLGAVNAITSMADLQTNHMSQSGGNVLIDLGGGNSVTLLNVSLSDLDATDFVF